MHSVKSFFIFEPRGITYIKHFDTFDFIAVLFSGEMQNNIKAGFVIEK